MLLTASCALSGDRKRLCNVRTRSQALNSRSQTQRNMVRFKNRYLLVELSFASVEDGNEALRAITPKSMVLLVRDAVQRLHGDYGLACVQQSLHGK